MLRLCGGCLFNEEPFWPLTQAYTHTSDQVSKQKQIFGTTPPEGVPAPFPTAMGNFASCPSQIGKMPFSEELCVRVQLYVRVCGHVVEPACVCTCEYASQGGVWDLTFTAFHA